MKLLNIRLKINQLLYHYSHVREDSYTLRSFCFAENLNYGSINNALQREVIGIQLVDNLKTIFPDLNVNWLLYDEGEMMVKNEDINMKVAR